MSCLLAPFYAKAALYHRGHKGLLPKIVRAIDHKAPVVWFHCASMGEFEQGRPIMERYRQLYPDEKILLTFFSPSGYEPRKNYEGADWVFYLPLDTLHNVRRFLDAVQPSKAIFIKYEFWYNYLRILKKRDIPTYVVSAVFRPSQPFFKWYGGFFRRMLSCFTRVLVQDKASLDLLQSIGIQQVKISGDTRFDRVCTQAQQPKVPACVKAFCADERPVCVAGSTWPRDEAILREALRAFPELKIILVPHEVDLPRITQVLLNFTEFSPHWFSQFQSNDADQACELNAVKPVFSPQSRVLVIDAMGWLSSIYSVGNWAYVGGGFEDGIHNILEAAVYGIPVLFGPQYHKYNEAKELIALGGVHSIRTASEALTHIQLWMQESSRRQSAGSICADYVRTHIGATEKVLENIR
jgi:3-deoxy-D-manno-octulosonic-acid transferase